MRVQSFSVPNQGPSGCQGAGGTNVCSDVFVTGQVAACTRVPVATRMAIGRNRRRVSIGCLLTEIAAFFCWCQCQVRFVAGEPPPFLAGLSRRVVRTRLRVADCWGLAATVGGQAACPPREDLADGFLGD